MIKYNQKMSTREQLNIALNEVADREWRLWGLMGPEYITLAEANFLRCIAYLMPEPERFLPFLVRQLGGIEGEEAFKKALKKLMIPKF